MIFLRRHQFRVGFLTVGGAAHAVRVVSAERPIGVEGRTLRFVTALHVVVEFVQLIPTDGREFGGESENPFILPQELVTVEPAGVRIVRRDHPRKRDHGDIGPAGKTGRLDQPRARLETRIEVVVRVRQIDGALEDGQLDRAVVEVPGFGQ